MIGKIIPRRSDGRSSFYSVTRYIAGEGHGDKCSYIGSRNLALADFPGLERPQDFIQLAAAEMESTAVQNRRVGNPILHVVISWPYDERPTKDQFDEAVEKMEHNYGLGGCQCVYGVHQNTEHMHLHIAYNRVHPESYKAIKPANNWTKKELEKTVRELELEQGWRIERSGKHYTVRDGQVVPVKALVLDTTIPPLSENARRIEAHTGERSAQSTAMEKITPELISGVRNWPQLHEHLMEIGVEYRRKGSGAIFLIDGVEVKASSVSKKYTLSKLEKRLGAFEEKIERTHEKKEKIEAHDAFTTEKSGDEEQSRQNWFATYKEAKTRHAQEKKEARSALRERHQAEREELRIEQRESREEAYGGRSWKGKGAELNFLRSILAIEHARQRKELQERQMEERNLFTKKHGRFASFKDWFGGGGGGGKSKESESNNYVAPQEAGNYVTPSSEAEANAWAQSKKKSSAIYADNTTAQPEKKSMALDAYKMVAAQDATWYMKEGSNRPAIIDKGTCIETQTMDEEAILATLQLANEKWGGCNVHGSHEYVETCMRLAVEHGLNIGNPKLQERMEEIRAKQEQAREGAQQDQNIEESQEEKEKANAREEDRSEDQVQEESQEEKEKANAHEEDRGEDQVQKESQEVAAKSKVGELDIESAKREVEDLKLVNGNPNIRSADKKIGNYKGAIVHIDKEYVVQKVGQKTLIVHDKNDLAKVPEKGEQVKITYKENEKARAEPVRERGNEQALSL